MESNHKINNEILEPHEIWKRNQNQCSLALQTKYRKHDWYVYIGCSNHMTSDRKKFLTMKKERDESISFGNNHSAKIIGRGTINLGRKDAIEENVLLVEDMKQNLLSVSQMCNQGHKLQFDSDKCEIKKEGSVRLVTTMIRTLNNIYVLNKIGKESCF
jgi:hypothetical protein